MSSRHVDTLIVGAGTAGCVLAHRLSQDPAHSVALVEAGPDFGPAGDGRWPEAIASWGHGIGHHDWGHQTEIAGRRLPYFAGKVIGGSSATNQAGMSMGLRRDYDRWVELGNPGWGFDDLLPCFHLVERLEEDAPMRGRRGMVPVQRLPGDTPLALDVQAAAVGLGLPAVTDVSGPDTLVGVGGATRNLRGRTRYSSAAAYLDPARDRANLAILSDTIVESLIWKNGAVSGAHVRGGRTGAIGAIGAIGADRIVLAAGAIGSPVLLQRSGIGDPPELRAILGSTASIHPLPGVGRNLRDHCGVMMLHLLRAGAIDRLFAGAPADGLVTRAGVLMRVSSDPLADAFDHDVICAHPSIRPERREEERLISRVFHVQPECEGSVTIASGEAGTPPRIDTGFGGARDVADIARVVEWVRRLAATEPLAGWLEQEQRPGPDVRGDALTAWVRDSIEPYFHPVGTCKLGPASDPMAVVDPTGRVHGFENLYVADASVMPTIPRGMINLTVYAIAEKIAAGLTPAARTTSG